MLYACNLHALSKTCYHIRMDPHVSNQRAREAAERPRTFRGHEVAISSIVIYDDVAAADVLAEELGTVAKHASPKHEGSSWQTFSIVRLPDGWEKLDQC